MVKKLSNELIKYIAAGEVIESPYSVVKELVENAIDANADYISIFLKDGGLSSIKVYDNGDGIQHLDLHCIAERYTTSKITNIEDLTELKTFGFRGEALASIAAVSKFEIISCHKNSVDRTAYRAIYENNRMISKEEYPHSQGTTILVEDLFYNTPARKKFLKKATTEIRNIHDLIVKLSIVHPNIRFSLYSDDKNIYSTYGHTEPDAIMLSHLRKLNMKNHILNIDIETMGIKITGFISDSKFTVKRKKEQILSVNNRLVENPDWKKVIEQGYRKYIPKNLYPIYYINIELDTKEIDVNCHPRKDIVKFSNDEELQILLYETISSLFHIALTEPREEKENLFTDEEKTYTVIGQLKNSYIIIEYIDTVYFIDQHALHERILYEKYLEELKNKESTNIPLKNTFVIHLSQQQMNTLEIKGKILEEYGFDIVPFGPMDVLVREVPYLIVDNDIEEIREIIETIIDNDKSNWLDLLIMELSCKSAIKVNTILDETKIREFIDFMIDKKITNCPHGRPIFFTMSFNEMNRKLKRII